MFRCNFDKAQRVTWIDLAISLSLHKDACIAVWLDIDLGKTCPVFDLRLFRSRAFFPPAHQDPNVSPMPGTIPTCRWSLVCVPHFPHS